MRKPTKSELKWSIGLLSLVGLGGLFLAFIVAWSGLYNIAAVSPHYPFEIEVITFVKKRSVARRASHLDIPNLEDMALIKRGFDLYQVQCLTCHGAPNDPSSKMIRGLNPVPPPLVQSAEHWSDKELAWIIKNGFKMTGMPGFKLGEDSHDLHSLTAFVKRMNTLSPVEYRNMQRVANQKMDDTDVQWLPPPQGWDELAKKGRPQKGQKLLKNYGCLGCHDIDGVEGADGQVGPPLNDWRDRHYIAGKIINNPLNLVHWLKRPQHVEYHTSMPDLKVSDEDAWDMAAFLYQD